MEQVQEYKNQSIILFGFESPVTISIFKLAEFIENKNISLDVGLFNIELLLSHGLKEEFNV